MILRAGTLTDIGREDVAARLRITADRYKSPAKLVARVRAPECDISGGGSPARTRGPDYQNAESRPGFAR